SSVTTILAYLVGRSDVSAITQTPASGPLGPATTPPISLAPTVGPCCALAGASAANTRNSNVHRLNFIANPPAMLLIASEPLCRKLTTGPTLRKASPPHAWVDQAPLRVGGRHASERDHPTGVAGPGSAEMVVAAVGVVVERNGRSSMTAIATKDSTRQSAAATNTQRNTSAISMPSAPAKEPSEAAPRSGTAPSQARM